MGGVDDGVKTGRTPHGFGVSGFWLSAAKAVSVASGAARGDSHGDPGGLAVLAVSGSHFFCPDVARR